jgi:hypothetical protein
MDKEMLALGPNVYAIYNYPIFLELLCKKINVVSKLVGEPLLPTYSCARKYRKNSLLPIHIDRPSCEISLTVNLYNDKDWPINFIVGDNVMIFNILPGDALIYLGTQLPHWRELYTGEEYAQVFFHYVKSRGNNRRFYFDRN